jgi:hypothetical protein
VRINNFSRRKQLKLSTASRGESSILEEILVPNSLAYPAASYGECASYRIQQPERRQ